MLQLCLSMKVIIARFPLQVSRSTGILSHFVNLNIVIPEAFILGSGEHHVDVGSIINLVCIIEKVRISFFLIPFHSFRRNKNSILQRLDEWLMQSYSIFFLRSYLRRGTYHSPPPPPSLFFCRLRNCNHHRPARIENTCQRYFIVLNNKKYTGGENFSISGIDTGAGKIIVSLIYSVYRPVG